MTLILRSVQNSRLPQTQTSVASYLAPLLQWSLGTRLDKWINHPNEVLSLSFSLTDKGFHRWTTLMFTIQLLIGTRVTRRTSHSSQVGMTHGHGHTCGCSHTVWPHVWSQPNVLVTAKCVVMWLQPWVWNVVKQGCLKQAENGCVQSTWQNT